MDQRQIQKLIQKFGSRIQTDTTMATFTTLQIGGPIPALYEAQGENDLLEIVEFAQKERIPYFILGGGSNLLVSDKGIDALVIKIKLKGIELKGNELHVKSGTPLQDVIEFTISKGLSGLQKLTGIPGTIGGAVYGNAGAYGQTISDYLVSVLFYDGTKVTTFTKEESHFSYRDSIFKQNKGVIISITFKLTDGNRETLQAEASEIQKLRIAKYPPSLRCPGSFFKNIIASELPKNIRSRIPEERIIYDKIPAGVVLELVGAKGQQLGNIEIAPYHANLIINKGNGTATDFYKLALIYYRKVKEKFGISLEPEVQLINLPPLS